MERLPRGRHGLSPEFVAQNQRERLIAGLTEVLYEVGYQKTTVSLIGQRAAVSKSDFYKHFESKDDCFFAAYEDAIERIRERVVDACAEHEGDPWSLRVRDAIAALLQLLAEDRPSPASSLVEGLRAGPRRLRPLPGGGRELRPLPARRGPGPSGEAVPAATDEAVVGGIASLLGRRVLAGEAEQIDQLLPDVLEFALTPYLGTAEARRIISAG